MTILVKDIQSDNWSLSNTTFGEVVTDLDDISQCIYIIITTMKGSDPFRPDFGVDIAGYVDQPTPKARAKAIVEITTAIKLWETRAVVESIEVQDPPDGGGIAINVVWYSGLKQGSTQANYGRTN